MFPMASPNPLFGGPLASGGATPGTLDFHRTAMSAAAASRGKDISSGPSFDNLGISSSIEQPSTTTATASKSNGKNVSAMTDVFGHPDANDAANGLFLLAQAKHDPQNPSQGNKSGNASSRPQEKKGATGGGQHQDEMSLDNPDDGSDSGKSEGKPITRSRGKKSTPKKSGSAGRRKADGPPSGNKAPASKRAKASSPEEEDDDDDDMDEDMKDFDNDNHSGKDTRKMTDEEKRKNFLERNRYVTRFLDYIIASSCVW
jgi:ATF/CREB family transcription factor